MILASLDILSVLRNYGLTTGPLVLLLLLVVWLVRLLFDEDRAALWRGRVYRAVHALTRRRDAEKKYISNDINARINLARRSMYFGEKVLPKAVRVEWVEGTEAGTYDISEGEFVVRLDPADSQERNIANLACAVVRRTTLVGLRHVVSRPLQNSIDLSLVAEILRQIPNRRFLDWFLLNEYDPRKRDKGVLSEWLGKLGLLNERGLFTRVLLVELDEFAKRVADRAPRPYMTGVVEAFVEFLYRIATKRVGEDVPLDFNRAHLNVGFILVASRSKLINEGIEPYVRAMRHHIREEMDAVYVVVSIRTGEVSPAEPIVPRFSNRRRSFARR